MGNGNCCRTALGSWGGYGWRFAQPFDIGNSEEAWLDAVAKQVSLYSRESVASIPVDETTQKTDLDRLSEILKVDLSQARVALPGLTLKLLQIENRPLAQLLYEGEHGVVVVQSRSSFAGVPLLGSLYKGVETLPQEPSDLS
jgi:hypothetical protein